MAYQDEWNLISGSKAYQNLSDSDKRKLGRIFARKVVSPEVGGGKSPEMRAFIEAYVAPKPKAEKGGFVAEAGRGFQDGFADNLTGSLYNLNQRMSGGQEIGDTSVAVEPSLLGPLGRAAGAVAGAVTDPVGRAIDYFTGGIGGKELSRGIQAISPVRQVAAAAIPGAVSGAVQGAGTVAAQGGDAGDMLRAGGLGLAGGAFFGNRAYGKNAPSGPAAPAPSAPAAPAPAGRSTSTYLSSRSPAQVAELRNTVARRAAAGDAKAGAILREIDSHLAPMQDNLARGNRASFALQSQDGPSPTNSEFAGLSDAMVAGRPIQVEAPDFGDDALAAIRSIYTDAELAAMPDQIRVQAMQEAAEEFAQSNPYNGPSKVQKRHGKTVYSEPTELGYVKRHGKWVRVDRPTQGDVFLGLSLDPNRAVDAGAAPSAAASKAAHPVKGVHGTSRAYLDQVQGGGGSFAGFTQRFDDAAGPPGAMYIDITPPNQSSHWMAGSASRMPSYEVQAAVESALEKPFFVRTDADVLRLKKEMGLRESDNLEHHQWPASEGESPAWSTFKAKGYDGVIVDVADEAANPKAVEALWGNHQAVVFDPSRVRLSETGRSGPNLAQRILTDEKGGMPIPNFGKIAEALVSDVGPARRQAAQAADNLVRAPRTPSGEKFAASVNMNRLDADDSVKATIESVAQSYKGQIDEARRGTITHEETMRMADELGISEKKILSRKAGEAWNAEQLLAARRVMMDTATELDGLAQKVIDGQATDADKVLLMDALQRHAAIQAEVAGATSEAGRALSQFRIAAKAGKAIPDIQSLMAELGGAGKIDDIAAAILAAPSGPQRNKLIRDLGRAKPTDVLSELFINSILSGPKTHITNAVGNSITVAARMAETAVAASIGKAGELVGAGPASTKFGEVTAQAYGSLQGLKEGAKLAAQVYRTGKSSGRFTPNEVERPGAISSQRLGLTGTPGKVADQVGKVVRIPGRALLSADEFFKSVHYRMDLQSQAYRQASSEGLHGPALAERITEIVDNPPEKMLEKARESAAYHTFNKPLKGDDPFTTVARSLSAARVNAPSISFIIPFIRTPANILKYAGERTPLAPLSKAIREDIKAGGARREQALSRIAVGTTLGASVLAYALEGHITGGGPTDPREREALRATGWQPYSIKTGDTYVSFQRLAPFGMIAGAAADVADILERSQSNDEKFNAVAALLTAAANNATSQTFLQGLTDFTEVLQDPDRYAGGYAGGFARALVPNVVRQAATAADPVVRDTRGDGGLVDSIVGGVVSGLPQSTSLPEKLDSFGQPIVREQASVGPIPASVVSYLNPLYTSRDKNDPVRDELYRLRVFPSSPKNTDGLPDEQFDQLVRSSGADAYQLVARIIASPAYQNPSLKDEDKAEVLRRAMRLSRTRSRRSVPRI